ncbi:peptide-methionine (S)-S-oxide reductase MsrA [Pseudahrensia aquimaris]|uniref:Peptide methionine sulfoxide reductase MsrA n=1 Tax=Pseudahrensia aquimaris TaxID=744461 RepID=A0ABW3FIJ1_9HYPH
MFLLDRLHAKLNTPSKDTALPGRDEPIAEPVNHFVNGRPIQGPYPDNMEKIVVGMGCFWGIERLFWETDGVWVTAVGYAAGHTPNPTYQEVCTGLTAHNEVVLIVFDPAVISLGELLKKFWENHDPTQGMRQGNDVGTQYRSGIYTFNDEQKALAEASRDAYASALKGRVSSDITTEIVDAPEFYFAEEYHQQYLAKNPGGYCNMKGVGVSCPLPQPAT